MTRLYIWNARMRRARAVSRHGRYLIDILHDLLELFIQINLVCRASLIFGHIFIKVLIFLLERQSNIIQFIAARIDFIIKDGTVYRRSND